MTDWKNGKGFVKKEESLTYIEIKDAGHMVPMNQPKLSLEMLNDFIHEN